MTLLDPHLDVDQVSAAVDGERDPGVAAHLLACLACREQVDAWLRALAPLRELPPAPGDVDRVIEAALATWSAAPGSSASGHLPSDSSQVGPGGVAGRLNARPGARGVAPSRPFRRRLRLPPSVAAAVAVVGLLAALVTGLHSLGGGSSTSSPGTSAAAPVAGTGRPAVVAPAPRSPAATASPSLSFSGTAQLAAQLRRAMPVAGVAVTGGAPCLRRARLLAARNPAVRAASPSFAEAVRLAGVEGQVFVFAGVHGDVAVVVRPDTCSLLATVLL